MKTRIISNSCKQSGMILVLVLALLALLAALSFNLIHLSSMRQREKKRRFTQAQLQAVMTDAALHTLQVLADDPDLDVDHPDEAWTSVNEFSTPDGISLTIRVSDENRRFDLNNLSLESDPTASALAAERLMDALTYFGDYESMDRVHALADWLDPDDNGLWEQSYYADRQPPARCPNTWMNALSDTIPIAGFSHDYFMKPRELRHTASPQKLADYLTVIPGPRRHPTPINVNTASPVLLRAIMGLDQDAWVGYLLALRQNAPLASLDTLFALLDPAAAAQWKPFLAVKSSLFLITIRAYSEHAMGALRVLAARDSDSGNTSIIKWVF